MRNLQGQRTQNELNMSQFANLRMNRQRDRGIGPENPNRVIDS